MYVCVCAGERERKREIWKPWMWCRGMYRELVKLCVLTQGGILLIVAHII